MKPITFEEYWERHGELHASLCNGDIKQFAREIWESANQKHIVDGYRNMILMLLTNERKLLLAIKALENIEQWDWNFILAHAEYDPEVKADLENVKEVLNTIK